MATETVGIAQVEPGDFVWLSRDATPGHVNYVEPCGELLKVGLDTGDAGGPVYVEADRMVKRSVRREDH